MKSGSTRSLVVLLVFGSFLLSLACSSSPTNQNTNTTNQNANSKVSIKRDIGEVCPTGADFQTKKDNLEDEIDDEMLEKGLLNSQKDERFKYNIVEFGTAPNKGLELQITGLLRDHRAKGEPTVEDFLDIIDEYMDKGCIQRVTFLKRAYGPGELTSDGFDWQACEFPKVYCSNGVCQDSCVGVANTNTSSNTSNSNSSNSNNSNANNSNRTRQP